MDELRNAIGGWAETASKHAGALVGLGVVIAIAGILAIAYPMASGIGVSVVIGIALAIAGVARVVAAFRAGSFGQGALGLVGGILTLVAGLVLAARPGIGLEVLTLLFGIYLLIDGISGVVLALHVRPQQGWGWMVVSAVLGVVLGLMLLFDWPFSGIWAIGTLVGVNLLFSGISIATIGTGARGVAKKLASATRA